MRETFITIALYVISLVFSVALVHASSIISETQMEFQLLGKPDNTSFVNSFFKRVWIYWLLPGIFSFTGIGLVLFPNSKVQDALNRVPMELLEKEGPYSQTVTNLLGLEGGNAAVIGAIVVSILLIALARIVVVTYNSAVFTTIYFYFLGSVGVIGLMMTLNVSEKYVRLLVDYILGDKFQAGIVLIAVGALVGLFTELLLANQPVRGFGVGQIPGEGTYVCKTCNKSQYHNSVSHLELCGGRCAYSIFRKSS